MIFGYAIMIFILAQGIFWKAKVKPIVPGFTSFHPFAFTRYCLIHRHLDYQVKPVNGNNLIMVCVYEGTIKSCGIKAYHTENNETKIYSQNEKSVCKLYVFLLLLTFVAMRSFLPQVCWRCLEYAPKDGGRSFVSSSKWRYHRIPYYTII